VHKGLTCGSFPWRETVLTLLIMGTLAAVLTFPTVLQDPAYHRFADRRSVAGIPNFSDVVTNLPFLIIGVSGLFVLGRDPWAEARRSWAVFFAGVALVGIGSACYHLDPTDRTLVWDRLPMTTAFMGVLVAVLSERVDTRIEVPALLPAVLAGSFSVFWWSRTGDLRLYYWVQLLPILVIPAPVGLFPGSPDRDRTLMAAFLLYTVAKAAEFNDQSLYALTGNVISGHSLKHLAAATACAVLWQGAMSREDDGRKTVVACHGV
jgi:hypothetical protein